MALIMSLAQPVLACIGPMEASTLFFEAVPVAASQTDVIANVVLDVVQYGDAMATLLEVSKVPEGADIRTGRKVAIRFRYTSCGPHHRAGEEGLIVARLGAQPDGSMVLYPYLRRLSDGRIQPPPTN